MGNKKGFITLSVIAIGLALLALGLLALPKTQSPEVVLVEQLDSLSEELSMQRDEFFGALKDRFRFVGGQRYRLAGGGITATETSITLRSFTFPNSDTEITMDDFGRDIGYATLEPGSSTRQEFISFTGISQNASNTQATLSGITRGLRMNFPYDQDTSLRVAHAGGTTLIISNSPQFQDESAFKRNQEVITNVWSFTDGPVFFGSSTPYFETEPVSFSSSTAIATVGYVNTVAFNAAPDAASSTPGLVVVAEPQNIASGTPPGAQGTTSPHALTTIHSFANQSDCSDTSTSSWCIVITQSDGRIDQAYLDLDTEDWNFDNDSDGRGRVAIATSTFSIGIDLSVGGNVLIGATATVSHLVATSTVNFNGINLLFPSSAPASSSVLSSNGTGEGLYWIPRDAPVTFLIPEIVPHATSTAATRIDDRTTLVLAAYDITHRIKVANISIDVLSVFSADSVDITVYSEDGQTQHIAITTASISANGIVTTAVSPAVELEPGIYYIGINNNGASGDLDIMGWGTSGNACAVDNLSNGVSGQPDSCGTLSISAGAPPSTINEEALTASVERPVKVRFDD